MQKITSKDGTTIAFDRFGTGPAVIFVDGALGYRAFGQRMAQLAEFLAQHFTVFHYDRRGRGDSTDNQPYAVEREIEDIEAVINEAGGSAFVYGISSGAALAMKATIKLGDKIKKLAMYEPPYNDDDDARQAAREYTKKLKELLAAGRYGDAVGLFMMLMGMPSQQLDEMRKQPMWPLLEAVAPTLAYDDAVMGEDSSVPTTQAAYVAVPTLVMNGGKSPPFMYVTAMTLVKAIPYSQHFTLKGQTHDVAVEAVGPLLVDFFKD